MKEIELERKIDEILNSREKPPIDPILVPIYSTNSITEKITEVKLDEQALSIKNEVPFDKYQEAVGWNDIKKYDRTEYKLKNKIIKIYSRNVYICQLGVNKNGDVHTHKLVKNYYIEVKIFKKKFRLALENSYK
jgi:hypothetical protein